LLIFLSSLFGNGELGSAFLPSPFYGVSAVFALASREKTVSFRSFSFIWLVCE
jgi:hypothetical protein